jgi:hypothetical protein
VRANSLLRIAVIQVAAALGTTSPATATNPAKRPEPTAMQTICARVQEPSATALRLVVEQAQLRKSMPGVPWTLLLTLLTVPINIVVWQVLWRVATGDGLGSERKQDWSSRTRQRQMVIPQAGAVRGNWNFPSSMTPPRR